MKNEKFRYPAALAIGLFVTWTVPHLDCGELVESKDL